MSRAAGPGPISSAFLVRRFGADAVAWPELGVDPRDEMLGFALAARAGDWDGALADYLRDGAEVATSIRQLAEAWRGGFAGLGELLDFASGYGRVTRHLVRELPPARLWVADVVGEAVAAQERRFGVHGLVSTTDPAAWRCDRRFDLVFVTSLFTHLPERTFRAWLSRLVEVLAPAGLLAFSVHDASLAPPDLRPGSAGMAFLPESESRTLDPRDYGTAWVTPGFVSAAVAAIDPRLRSLRVPRGLCGFHDLWLVAREGQGDLAAAAAALDAGPEGYIEETLVEDGVRLSVAGWALDRKGATDVASVALLWNGREIARAERFSPRAGVDWELPGSPGIATDWRLEASLPRGEANGAAVVEVVATDRRAGERSLFLGRFHELLLALARARVERALDRETRLAGEVAGFRASRFGRAREVWIRTKKALGLWPAPQ
ncbi:MAG: class I SAM-dependent methyltransferase [Thermoanaerobaculia bacterium]